MNWTNFNKLMLIITVLSLDVSILNLWNNTFILGQYFAHATVFASMMVGLVIPVCVIALSFLVIKSIIKYK